MKQTIIRKRQGEKTVINLNPVVKKRESETIEVTSNPVPEPKTDLLSVYSQKAKTLQAIGFHGNLDKKKWLIQDVLQEAILKCYQRYRADNTNNDLIFDIEKPDHLLNRSMKNVTVDKWRSDNSEQRFIEFSNQKSEIESQNISVEGKQFNHDYWLEYRLTLKHVYSKISDVTDRIIFNLYHVKSFTMQEIANKLDTNKMTISRKVKSINRRLLKSGIKELYRLDFVVTEYREPDYKYSEKKPSDLKGHDNQVKKSWGKTYASELTVIDIEDYQESKQLENVNPFNPDNNYVFTKQAFKRTKKAVPAKGYINRDMIENSIPFNKGNPDNDLTLDILGFIDDFNFDTVNLFNDGLQVPCDQCGYSIDHCICNANQEYNDNQAYQAIAM